MACISSLRGNARLFGLQFATATLLALFSHYAFDVCSATAAEPAHPTKVGSIVGLTTQWYPERVHHDEETENKLLREIVRQSVLVAAREDVGLITRDETLEEPLLTTADSTNRSLEAAIEPLAIDFDLKADGHWHARLYGTKSGADSTLWQHDGKFAFDYRTMYPELADQMDAQCADVAAKLVAAGAAIHSAKLNPANKPDAAIETLLGQMNFVSQFQAVRSAHSAIQTAGPSLEWLGVLVRGYANLAMLTDHTWSSHYEAFAARSFVYASRLHRLSEGSTLAKWHQAYALAIVGAQGAAIDRLAEIEKANAKTDAKPVWAEVIQPYVEFDHSKWDGIVARHADLVQLTALLD